MFIAFTTGLLTGGSLIIAVGAQNAFLFEQAIKRQFAWLLATTFVISDIISITAGTLGFGYLITENPWIAVVAKWAGVAFLLWYAYGKWRASHEDDHLIIAKQTLRPTFKKVLLVSLAVTWLNPHFYLDTLVLMGSLSLQWQQNKWWFVAGGAAASWLWFYGLVCLGKLLSKYFESPTFWRGFNRINALIMLFIAWQISQIS